MMSCNLWMLVLAVCIASCSDEAALGDESSADDSVSGAEMPVGQVLALDSTLNVRVQESGLWFEEGIYADANRSWVPSSHKYQPHDSAYFTPIVKGWTSRADTVSMSSFYEVLSPSGKVVRSGGSGIKAIERFHTSAAPYIPFVISLAGLDSTAPHYDVRFRLKDRISGKSIEGLYRIHIDR